MQVRVTLEFSIQRHKRLLKLLNHKWVKDRTKQSVPGAKVHLFKTSALVYTTCKVRLTFFCQHAELVILTQAGNIWQDQSRCDIRSRKRNQEKLYTEKEVRWEDEARAYTTVRLTSLIHVFAGIWLQINQHIFVQDTISAVANASHWNQWKGCFIWLKH